MVGWYRLRWIIEQVFRYGSELALPADRDSQMQEAGRFIKLAVIALIAAVRAMQLVLAREGNTGQPVTDAVDPAQMPAMRALNASLEGRTAKSSNPHNPATLAWYAWIVARLGGWSGYTSRGAEAAGTKDHASWNHPDRPDHVRMAPGKSFRRRATPVGRLTRGQPDRDRRPPDQARRRDQSLPPRSRARAGAACIDMQLVQERDGKDRLPASNVFSEPEIETLKALCPMLEGKTSRQQNLHRSRAWPPPCRAGSGRPWDQRPAGRLELLTISRPGRSPWTRHGAVLRRSAPRGPPPRTGGAGPRRSAARRSARSAGRRR